MKCFVHENIREYRKTEIRNRVCNALPIDYEHNGHNYCILHLPDENKNKEQFNGEFKKKTNEKDFDFRAVYFPIYVDLSDIHFENPVDFRSAHFTKNVAFIGSKFKENARFSWAVFQADTFFDLAIFEKKALFDSSIFGQNSDINFRGVTFSGTADFSYATFSGFIEFGWKDKKYSREEDIKTYRNSNDRKNVETCYTTFRTRLKLQHIRLESPNKVKFHSVRLRPHWFINTEAAKFIFTNCRWKLLDKSNTNVQSELRGLRYLKIQQPHKLLQKTYWQLVENHEENKSFPKASVFRKFAQEAKRKEEYNGWKFWSWQWWYWLTSFYGESPFRAGIVLAGLLLLFALAFMLSDFQVCPIVKLFPGKQCDLRSLYFGEAILNSLATATFQNIDYLKPASEITTFIIILEKIFVPLQTAFLALAIRRKFMR